MSVHDDMLAILRADSALNALLPGGIFDEPLDPEDDVTGAAWQPDPVSGVLKLQPCAVMLRSQEVDHPGAQNIERRLDVDMWPDLYFYAERADMGDVFDQADVRAMSLLHKITIGLADVSATGYRSRPMPTTELRGDVWNTLRRYRVQNVYHL